MTPMADLTLAWATEPARFAVLVLDHHSAIAGEALVPRGPDTPPRNDAAGST